MMRFVCRKAVSCLIIESKTSGLMSCFLHQSEGKDVMNVDILPEEDRVVEF